MVRYDLRNSTKLIWKKNLHCGKEKNTRKHHFELPFHKRMKPRNHFTFLELCK
jgi:hypothetical protein